MQPKQSKVSIIIPVYNVEKYIEKCVRTLFGQTLDSLEYVFVDDSNPDRSIEVMQDVLKEFPQRQEQVKLIRHTTNKGVGQSRQDGIDAATGEYIIHCDPDDWVDLNMYEKLYTTAKETDADIVICDYIEETASESRLKHQYFYNSKKEMFSDIVNNKFHMSLCNKLIKTNIISTRIPKGVNLWEDMTIVIPALFSCNNIAIENSVAYHYRVDNFSSIVHNISDSNIISMINAMEAITNFFINNSFISSINYSDLLLLQWKSKRGLLHNATHEKCKIWKQTFAETSIKYNQLQLPLKSKILSLLANHNCYRLINLISKLNCK